MKKQYTPEEMLVRMEELCARSEQCTFDIRRKLYARGIRGESADRIIQSLTERKFIDDLRFAHAFVREKHRFSAWGRNKIRAWMAARGFGRDTIDRAMTEIDSKAYVAGALAAMRAKARSLPDSLEPRLARDRVMRFGLARGYETSLVIKIMESGKLWQDS